ncbi:hypothetical protein L6R46_13555, partial [Myxococcota bacterium]|nr:hypothetical protein [Myxococcota bacterium]
VIGHGVAELSQHLLARLEPWAVNGETPRRQEGWGVADGGRDVEGGVARSEGDGLGVPEDRA